MQISRKHYNNHIRHESEKSIYDLIVHVNKDAVIQKHGNSLDIRLKSQLDTGVSVDYSYNAFICLVVS